MELPLPDPLLRDDRAALRAWTAADAAALLTGATDPLVHHYRHSLPEDAGGARLWLLATERARESGERLELAVTAATDPDARAVGSVSLWSVHRRNRDAMMSWWLARDGRGRGLGTAAVALLAGWAFETLGIERIAAWTEVDNAASQALAERVGFVREGRLREEQRRRDGSRADCYVYGLLVPELRGRRDH